MPNADIFGIGYYGDTPDLPETYGSDNDPSSDGNTYSLDFSEESGYLRDLLEGKTDWIQKRKQAMFSNISEQDTRAKAQEKARLAQSGMLGSGVGGQTMADITGKTERAMVQGESEIAQIEDQAKRYAIGQLLGIENMKMQNFYQGQNLGLNKDRTALAHDQFNEQRRHNIWSESFQEEQYNQAQHDKWIELFGGLLGVGGQMFGGYMGMLGNQAIAGAQSAIADSNQAIASAIITASQNRGG